MASAELIFKIRETLKAADGRIIVLCMDLYQLPEPFDPTYPDGYRFSWIAFDDDNPDKRVLFDCHPPKGPHKHIDEDKIGVRVPWRSVQETRDLFFRTIVEHFGEIPDLEGVI